MMEIPLLLCAATKSALAAAVAATAWDPATVDLHPPVDTQDFSSGHGTLQSVGQETDASVGVSTATGGYGGSTDLAGADSAHSGLNAPPTSPSDFLGSIGEPSALTVSPGTDAVPSVAGNVADAPAATVATPAHAAATSPEPVVASVDGTQVATAPVATVATPAHAAATSPEPVVASVDGTQDATAPVATVTTPAHNAATSQDATDNATLKAIRGISGQFGVDVDALQQMVDESKKQLVAVAQKMTYAE